MPVIWSTHTCLVQHLLCHPYRIDYHVVVVVVPVAAGVVPASGAGTEDWTPGVVSPVGAVAVIGIAAVWVSVAGAVDLSAPPAGAATGRLPGTTSSSLSLQNFLKHM